MYFLLAIASGGGPFLVRWISRALSAGHMMITIGGRGAGGAVSTMYAAAAPVPSTLPRGCGHQRGPAVTENLRQMATQGATVPLLQ